MRIVEFVREHASTIAAREAIVDGSVRVTYGNLFPLVERAVSAFFRAGVNDGSVVAFFGNPGLEYVRTQLATHLLNAAWLGVNPKYKSRELSPLIEGTKPELIIVDRSVSDAEYAALLDACDARSGIPWIVRLHDRLGDYAAVNFSARCVDRPPVDPSTAFIVYTSGSTGKPKGACLTHTGVVAAAHIYADRYQHENQRQLLNLPINHVGALVDITATNLLSGGTLIMDAEFDPSALHQLLKDERISVLGQVPAQHLAIEAVAPLSRDRYPHLQHLIWSGAAMPSTWVKRNINSGIALSTCYGLTECTGSVTFSKPGADLDVLTETVGAPVDSDWFRVLSPTGELCATGDKGEIQISGPLVMAGYLNDPDGTKDALTDDHWLRTGDVGFLNGQGNLVLSGRIKDMYKSGGYNVYPAEIEAVVESHPAVVTAAIVSVPDQKWQEVGWCYVIPSGDITTAELENWCRERLANYKVPKKFVVVSQLPTLPIGKVDKQSLQRRAREMVI